MNHPRSRYPLLAAAVLAVGASAAAVLVGCDSKRPATSIGAQPATGPAKDGEAAALAELAAQPDAEHCRKALQQLDNLDSAGTRPTLTDPERAELVRFLRLTPAEATEAGQTTFSQNDAGYLEECLLVRAGVRSLRIDARTPAERARLGFDWVCRMIYIEDRWPAPTNPWTTFQSGSGVPLSRAYAVLSAWQQLGLDGCLVGPPDLEKTSSVTAADPTEPGARPAYAPVRACAVKVGGDLLLFDPAAGAALSAADGKGPVTLAQVRAHPELAKGLANADEVKTWQPFLAPALPGVGRRMEWLERFNPGNLGAKLFVDVGRQRAEFAKDLGGLPVGAWNPDGDQFGPGRVLARYASEEASSRSKVALRDRHRIAMIPLEYMPKTILAGNALAHVHQSFGRPFEMLRYSSHSARDLIVRGQFSEGTSALEDVKKLIDNARTRLEQDKNLQRDFDTWAEQFQSLSAQAIRAEREDPASLPAVAKAFENFRNHPKNRDVERAFILGHAARPLAAEVAFLMATAVHERAERAQFDTSVPAVDRWRNAAEWWGRFLDSSAQAKSPSPAREQHARALLARCKQFTAK